MGRKLFCDINPTCYKISEWKCCRVREIKDFFGGEKFAAQKSAELLPNVVKGHSSVLVRRLEGVDMRLQENKVTNIALAAAKINGIVVNPGETFSFWRTVGKTGAKQGYKEGLVIRRGASSAAESAAGFAKWRTWCTGSCSTVRLP